MEIVAYLLALFVLGTSEYRILQLTAGFALFMIGIWGVSSIQNEKMSKSGKLFGALWWGGIAYGSTLLRVEITTQWVYLILMTGILFFFVKAVERENEVQFQGQVIKN